MNGVIGAIISVLIGAIPFSRWIKNSRAAAAFSFAKAVFWVAVLKFQGAEIFGFSVSESELWLFSLLLYLGHCYSPFARTQRPVGLLPSVGALAILAPWSAAVGAAAYGLARWVRGDLALAALCGIALSALIYGLFYPLGAHAWIAATWVIWLLHRHEPEWERLIEAPLIAPKAATRKTGR